MAVFDSYVPEGNPTFICFGRLNVSPGGSSKVGGVAAETDRNQRAAAAEGPAAEIRCGIRCGARKGGE